MTMTCVDHGYRELEVDCLLAMVVLHDVEQLFNTLPVWALLLCGDLLQEIR